MSVTSVSALPLAPEPEAFKTFGKKELDKQDFMKLFITQLQYQDPMEPMDTYQMSSQLAQFSSMEATLRMSENMEELLAYQTSQNNLQLLTLLDNKVQTAGNTIAVNEGTNSSTEFVLEDTAVSCLVEIYDQGGTMVRQIDMGPVPAGLYELAWDGKNMGGDQVEDGVYSYRVKASDSVGKEIGTDYRTTGTVTGIGFDNGQAILNVDKYITVTVGEVLKVM
ncbi:MAG: flagellar hook assembly protein FlgD [Proteobacteria bacterium]|nr:flagellar hook assembly protein FlgD [Pseudomonadota bacterium]MBU1737343.1 flagellar hook assembly protein FlgD [Pseudomonadota bacterium]